MVEAENGSPLKHQLISAGVYPALRQISSEQAQIDEYDVI